MIFIWVLIAAGIVVVAAALLVPESCENTNEESAFGWEGSGLWQGRGWCFCCLLWTG